jgi:hypothetical protein
MQRGETFLGGRVWEEKHWLKWGGYKCIYCYTVLVVTPNCSAILF